MSILGKLLRTGVAAGAAYAAVKIGEKYKEKNPAGDPSKTMDAFKEAAGEFYKQTSETVKEKAPAMMETVQAKAQEAYEFAKEKAPGATAMAEDLYNKAREKAPEVVETVQAKAQEAVEFAKEKAPGATAKAEELIGKAKDYINSLDEEPVDGEVVEFEAPAEVQEEAAEAPAEASSDEEK